MMNRFQAIACGTSLSVLVLAACGGSGSGEAGSANTGGAGGASASSSGTGGAAIASASSSGTGGAAIAGDPADGNDVLHACTGNTSASPVERLSVLAPGALDAIFDPSLKDTVGPGAWDVKYGKTPELVGFSTGRELDMLFHAGSGSPSSKGYLVHAEPTPKGYAITRAYSLGVLGRIMGMTRDEQGNYYMATGISEGGTITNADPAPGLHRPDIVRVVKFDTSGCVLLEVDVDMARGAKAAGSDAIVNPMVASSSRLAYGKGHLALVHGFNTPPDNNGVRHQKAMTTHIDATSGVVTRESTMWVSHSFDARLLFDGTGFVELHLGDAYPRALAFGRFNETESSKTYSLFKPKGKTGDNTTYTRLGGISPITAGDYGYLAVFSTERAPDETQGVARSLDLALVRVLRDFTSKDGGVSIVATTAATTQEVMSSGKLVTNHLQWLTDHGKEANTPSAERPRVVAIGSDRFILLWERWERMDGKDVFAGTFGLVVDGGGAVTVAAKKLGDFHLSRGDDAFLVDGRAAVMVGDASEKSLVLRLIGADLSVMTQVIAPSLSGSQ